jgi:hypothetical protein
MRNATVLAVVLVPVVLAVLLASPRELAGPIAPQQPLPEIAPAPEFTLVSQNGVDRGTSAVSALRGWLFCWRVLRSLAHGLCHYAWSESSAVSVRSSSTGRQKPARVVKR